MFVRPFRTKSNAAIRGSDRKRLRKVVEELYPGLDEPATSIIPNKDEINVLKLYSHKGDNVMAYCLEKNPIFFEVEKKIYPTLYFVWQHQLLMPCLTTHQPVIGRLANGADLMLPGVVIPVDGELPLFEKGTTVTITAEGSMSALAVGIALMSSYEMMHSEERRGKAVQVLHIFGDHLWAVGEKLQPPQNDASLLTSVVEISNEFGDSFQCAGSSEKTTIEDNTGSQTEATTALLDLKLDAADAISVSETSAEFENRVNLEKEGTSLQDQAVFGIAETKDQEEDVKQDGPEEMDELLNNCFMTALKTKLKDTELPILASNFYRLHVLPCCPSDQYLDIKKTSFKKLSKYLKSLEKKELLVVKELTKGNDNIVHIDRSHDELKTFKPLIVKEITNEEDSTPNTESQFGVITQKQYEPPEISLLYAVNAATLPLFSMLGYGKGSSITSGDVRKSVTSYVREKELFDGKLITLDPILHDVVCGKQEHNVTTMSWSDLFNRLLSKMQNCHQLRFQGMRPIVKKGDPPTVEIATAQRTGNKKVTLVKNLESFLIDPNGFADTMRKLAQASTSVTILPGSKPNQPMHQVLIQGNQVNGVEALLTGKQYRLPRKYLKGLELAPKRKLKK